MLNVSLLKLTGRTEEKMPAHKKRFCVNKRHHVLQLVAETEGAPGLVVSAPGPKTARERLVQEPAVGQNVDGLLRRFHLHCAEGVVPVLPHRFKRAARRTRGKEALHQAAGVRCATPHAEREYDLVLLPGGELECNLDGRAGIQSSPYPARES